MPFQKGHPGFGKGRPRGVQNQRTLSFQETLKKNNFDPCQALIDCYREAVKNYAAAVAKENQNEKMVSDVPQFLKIASELANKIAGYSYPRLASIEAIDPVMSEILDRIKQLKDLPEQELVRLAEAKIVEVKEEEVKKE